MKDIQIVEVIVEGTVNSKMFAKLEVTVFISIYVLKCVCVSKMYLIS